MNVVNTGKRGRGGTIVFSKRRVPCGIETGKVNIKLKQKKRENNIKKPQWSQQSFYRCGYFNLNEF